MKPIWKNRGQQEPEILALPIREAVKASGIGRTTLYTLISSGELPIVKIGTRTLVRKVDLEELLARNIVRRAA